MVSLVGTRSGRLVFGGQMGCCVFPRLLPVKLPGLACHSYYCTVEASVCVTARLRFLGPVLLYVDLFFWSETGSDNVRWYSSSILVDT